MIKDGIKNNKAGFTLPEIIVSISLFVIAIMLTSSMYVLSQRTYNKGASRGELVQNARVSLDRMTRELRQSVDIVTSLPTVEDDIEEPPPTEIFFQDGHDISQTTYLRYYLSGTNLKRLKTAYFFSAEPDIYVLHNSVDAEGDPPEELVIEDRIVGEYFNSLKYWGVGGLVHISIGLLKNQDLFNIKTSVFMRN